MLRKHPEDRITLSEIYELKWRKRMQNCASLLEQNPNQPINSTFDDYLQENESCLIKRDFSSNLSVSNDQKNNDSTNVEEHKMPNCSDKNRLSEFVFPTLKISKICL